MSSMPFMSTTPGRLLLVSAALYLFSCGAFLLWHSFEAFGIGLPAAITVSFVAVGLGMTDYGKETLMSVIVLPPLLWGFMYLIAEFGFHKVGGSWGWGILLLGVLALGKAAMPTPSV